MLREYQQKAIDEIRQHYREGTKKVLLHMSTGSGKTATFCEILKLTHEKGNPAVVAVRGRKLISQASDRLKREGVPHGILMAGHERNDELIQVCSIDTLYARRGKGSVPPAKMLVIDEAHQTSGEGYTWFLDQYPDTKILAVTATPHLKGGMRHVADEVVWPITAKELTAQGFLVPLRYFAPETPDLTGVKTVGDDYNQKELAERMKKYVLFGNIVEQYKQRAMGRPAILFAVDIEHSLMIVKKFEDAGIRAVHVDASSTDAERLSIIESLESGAVDVICNVGILTTGVDIPCIRAIIMARPTQSYNLWIQMIGRGTRPFSGKSDCVVIDHAGNVVKHGFLEDERACNLDGTKKGSGTPPQRECKACGAINPLAAVICRDCGEPLVSDEEEIDRSRHKGTDESAGMMELTRERYEDFAWRSEMDKLVYIAKKRNLKERFVYFKIKDRFGVETAEKAWIEIKKMPTWFNAAKRIQDSLTKSSSPLGLDQ